MSQLPDTQFLMSDDVTQEALGSISSDTREIKRLVKGMGAEAIQKSAKEISAAVTEMNPDTIAGLAEAAKKVTEASAALNSSVGKIENATGVEGTKPNLTQQITNLKEQVDNLDWKKRENTAALKTAFTLDVKETQTFLSSNYTVSKIELNQWDTILKGSGIDEAIAAKISKIPDPGAGPAAGGAPGQVAFTEANIAQLAQQIKGALSAGQGAAPVPVAMTPDFQKQILEAINTGITEAMKKVTEKGVNPSGGGGGGGGGGGDSSFSPSPQPDASTSSKFSKTNELLERYESLDAESKKTLDMWKITDSKNAMSEFCQKLNADNMVSFLKILTGDNDIKIENLGKSIPIGWSLNCMLHFFLEFNNASADELTMSLSEVIDDDGNQNDPENQINVQYSITQKDWNIVDNPRQKPTEIVNLLANLYGVTTTNPSQNNKVSWFVDPWPGKFAGDSVNFYDGVTTQDFYNSVIKIAYKLDQNGKSKTYECPTYSVYNQDLTQSKPDGTDLRMYQSKTESFGALVVMMALKRDKITQSSIGLLGEPDIDKRLIKAVQELMTSCNYTIKSTGDKNLNPTSGFQIASNPEQTFDDTEVIKEIRKVLNGVKWTPDDKPSEAAKGPKPSKSKNPVVVNHSNMSFQRAMFLMDWSKINKFFPDNSAGKKAEDRGVKPFHALSDSEILKIINQQCINRSVKTSPDSQEENYEAVWDHDFKQFYLTTYIFWNVYHWLDNSYHRKINCTLSKTFFPQEKDVKAKKSISDTLQQLDDQYWSLSDLKGGNLIHHFQSYEEFVFGVVAYVTMPDASGNENLIRYLKSAHKEFFMHAEGAAAEDVVFIAKLDAFKDQIWDQNDSSVTVLFNHALTINDKQQNIMSKDDMTKLETQDIDALKQRFAVTWVFEPPMRNDWHREHFTSSPMIENIMKSNLKKHHAQNTEQEKQLFKHYINKLTEMRDNFKEGDIKSKKPIFEELGGETFKSGRKSKTNVMLYLLDSEEKKKLFTQRIMKFSEDCFNFFLQEYDFTIAGEKGLHLDDMMKMLILAFATVFAKKDKFAPSSLENYNIWKPDAATKEPAIQDFLSQAASIMSTSFSDFFKTNKCVTVLTAASRYTMKNLHWKQLSDTDLLTFMGLWAIYSQTQHVFFYSKDEAQKKAPAYFTEKNDPQRKTLSFTAVDNSVFEFLVQESKIDTVEFDPKSAQDKSYFVVFGQLHKSADAFNTGYKTTAIAMSAQNIILAQLMKLQANFKDLSTFTLQYNMLTQMKSYLDEISLEASREISAPFSFGTTSKSQMPSFNVSARQYRLRNRTIDFDEPDEEVIKKEINQTKEEEDGEDWIETPLKAVKILQEFNTQLSMFDALRAQDPKQLDQAVDNLSTEQTEQVADILLDKNMNLKANTRPDDDDDGLKGAMIELIVEKFEDEGIFGSGGISVDPLKDSFKSEMLKDCNFSRGGMFNGFIQQTIDEFPEDTSIEIIETYLDGLQDSLNQYSFKKEEFEENSDIKGPDYQKIGKHLEDVSGNSKVKVIRKSVLQMFDKGLVHVTDLLDDVDIQSIQTSLKKVTEYFKYEYQQKSSQPDSSSFCDEIIYNYKISKGTEKDNFTILMTNCSKKGSINNLEDMRRHLLKPKKTTGIGLPEMQSAIDDSFDTWNQYVQANNHCSYEKPSKIRFKNTAIFFIIQTMAAFMMDTETMKEKMKYTFFDNLYKNSTDTIFSIGSVFFDMRPELLSQRKLKTIMKASVEAKGYENVKEALDELNLLSHLEENDDIRHHSMTSYVSNVAIELFTLLMQWLAAHRMDLQHGKSFMNLVNGFISDINAKILKDLCGQMITMNVVSKDIDNRFEEMVGKLISELWSEFSALKYKALLEISDKWQKSGKDAIDWTNLDDFNENIDSETVTIRPMKNIISKDVSDSLFQSKEKLFENNKENPSTADDKDEVDTLLEVNVNLIKECFNNGFQEFHMEDYEPKLMSLYQHITKTNSTSIHIKGPQQEASWFGASFFGNTLDKYEFQIKTRQTDNQVSYYVLTCNKYQPNAMFPDIERHVRCEYALFEDGELTLLNPWDVLGEVKDVNEFAWNEWQELVTTPPAAGDEPEPVVKKEPSNVEVPQREEKPVVNPDDSDNPKPPEGNGEDRKTRPTTKRPTSDEQAVIEGERWLELMEMHTVQEANTMVDVLLEEKVRQRMSQKQFQTPRDTLFVLVNDDRVIGIDDIYADIKNSESLITKDSKGTLIAGKIHYLEYKFRGSPYDQIGLGTRYVVWACEKLRDIKSDEDHKAYLTKIYHDCAEVDFPRDFHPFPAFDKTWDADEIVEKLATGLRDSALVIETRREHPEYTQYCKDHYIVPGIISSDYGEDSRYWHDFKVLQKYIVLPSAVNEIKIPNAVGKLWWDKEWLKVNVVDFEKKWKEKLEKARTDMHKRRKGGWFGQGSDMIRDPKNLDDMNKNLMYSEDVTNVTATPDLNFDSLLVPHPAPSLAGV